jgi:amino acid transporter
MEKKNYLSITSLVMIIFVGVFGFGNIANNFKAVGSRSATLFIIIALVYFLPMCLIMSEFASYAKDRASGIYSWIDIGLGKNLAYFALWCYFVANIFYLPTLATRIPTYLSFAFTGDANIGNVTMASLAVLALIGSLFVGVKFEKSFNKISTPVGYVSLFVAGIFIIGGIVSYLGLYGQPATPLALKNYAMDLSTRDGIASVLSTFAWTTFAFGGSELVGTYVDRVKNPAKDFPRALLLAALGIGALYGLGIISIAAFGTTEDFSKISLVNAVISGYAFMGNYYGLGLWFVKAIGFTYTVITMVALVLWTVALAKSVFSEAPEGTFPTWLTKKTETGVCKNALIFQTALAIFFILMTAFGGSAAGDLYLKIYDMSTISFMLPYLFLGLAYAMFRRKGLKAPFQITKNNTVASCIGLCVTLVGIIGVVFAGYDISKPISEQIDTFVLYYGGLAFFLSIGLAIKYARFPKAKKERRIILQPE